MTGLGAKREPMSHRRRGVKLGVVDLDYLRRGQRKDGKLDAQGREDKYFVVVLAKVYKHRLGARYGRVAYCGMILAALCDIKDMDLVCRCKEEPLRRRGPRKRRHTARHLSWQPDGPDNLKCGNISDVNARD